MKILLFDVETQGLDKEKTNITEIGARMIEWNLGKIGTWQSKWNPFSWLCYNKDYPAQTAEIVDLTGITDADLQDRGHPTSDVLNDFVKHLYVEADYIMAHNAPFDQGVLTASCARYGVKLPLREWICTLRDIPYPAKYKSRKLSHLALDHGMVVDGSALHRALGDVDLMGAFISSYYSLPEILKYRAEPSVVVRAVVPHPKKDGGVGKDFAKSLGYRWQELDDKIYELCWVKRLKVGELAAEEKRLSPYALVRLE